MGGHEDVAQILLGAGSTLDTTNSVRNPVLSAIIDGSLTVNRALLSHRVDSEVRYSGPSIKVMDAVAFALECRKSSIALEIARWRGQSD